MTGDQNRLACRCMQRSEKKPCVLFLHQGGELYGSDLVFSHVVSALAQDVNPVIVLDNHGPLVDRLKTSTQNIIIHPLGVLRRKHFNPAGMLKCALEISRAVPLLTRLIKQENVALIYSNTIGVIPGAFAAKLTKKPHIWHVHEIIQEPRFVGKTLATLVLTTSDKIVAVSNAVANFLKTGFFGDSNRIQVVYNAVAMEKFSKPYAETIRDELGIPQDCILIGLIGRIHFWKGQDFFLNVVSVIKRSGFSQFKVLIVGSTYSGYEWLLRDLQKKVVSLGLQENVIFCSYRQDVEKLYAGIDILVVPSTQPEPFSLVTLEGMAAGKPIVATAHGGPAELIEDGKTGFLVPVGEVQLMADRVLTLIRDPALRKTMGINARERVQCLFSLEQYYQKIRNLVLAQLKHLK